MSYQISISKRALKELEDLPVKPKKQITEAIDQLANEPRPVGCKKLKGEVEYLWRIKIGNYRVIYLIEDKLKVVEVRKIGDRKNIYG
jgi:mRNA interferase RelE/StbE